MKADRDVDIKALGMMQSDDSLQGKQGSSPPGEEGEAVTDEQLVAAIRQIQATMGRLSAQVEDMQDDQEAMEASREKSKSLIRQYIAERGDGAVQQLIDQMP
jgi:hypothetical protein